MNRLIKYCFLLFLFSSGLTKIFAQLDSCILISKNDFQGTLFQENYLIDISPDSSGKLKKKPIDWVNITGAQDWTPNQSIIVDFESALFRTLSDYMPKDEYEKSGIDDILKELSNYKRQYIGFLDSVNNQCLWINFYYSNESIDEPDNRILTVFGGGTDYFKLWINLTHKKIIGLKINGPI